MTSGECKYNSNRMGLSSFWPRLHFCMPNCCNQRSWSRCMNFQCTFGCSNRMPRQLIYWYGNHSRRLRNSRILLHKHPHICQRRRRPCHLVVNKSRSSSCSTLVSSCKDPRHPLLAWHGGSLSSKSSCSPSCFCIWYHLDLSSFTFCYFSFSYSYSYFCF